VKDRIATALRWSEMALETAHSQRKELLKICSMRRKIEGRVATREASASQRPRPVPSLALLTPFTPLRRNE